VVAAIRPDDVNVALLVHVLGAMLLVGALLVVAVPLLLAWRREDPGEVTTLTRLGLRWLLVGVVPSWIVMFVGALWVESEENLPDAVEDSAWLGIGHVTAEGGGILVLVSVVLSVLGLRRLRGEQASGRGLARAVGVVALVLLAAYAVAVWAMTAKPD
jgi:hypothetical protein